MDPVELTETVTRVLDLAAVAANALLAGALARSQRFDPVGFAVLAIVSGLGGGILRDVILQHGPPAAIRDYAYFATAIGAAAFAYLVRFEGRWWQPTYRWVDAAGLGCWAAVGAQRTLMAGFGWLPAILLGVLTAVGGGIIRDLLLQRTPIVFGGNTLYATAALAAAIVLVALSLAGYATVGMLSATIVGAACCLLAHHRGWAYPAFAGFAPRLRRRRGSQERDDR